MGMPPLECPLAHKKEGGTLKVVPLVQIQNITYRRVKKCFLLIPAITYPPIVPIKDILVIDKI